MHKPVAFALIRKPGYIAYAIGPRHRRAVTITTQEVERLMRGPRPWKPPRHVIK